MARSRGAKLSRLQKAILIGYWRAHKNRWGALHRQEWHGLPTEDPALRLQRWPPSCYPLERTLSRGMTRAQAATVSRAVRRLEARGLVFRYNAGGWSPIDGHPETRPPLPTAAEADQRGIWDDDFQSDTGSPAGPPDGGAFRIRTRWIALTYAGWNLGEKLERRRRQDLEREPLVAQENG